MNYLRTLGLLLATVVLGLFTLTSCSSPVLGQTRLTEQVLQIIRDHPEVVIESVQTYQQQQQERAQAARAAFAEKMRQSPPSVIGNSPTAGAAANTIVLLEFSDFQCPFCAKAHDTVKRFMAKHQDEVTRVYKAFPLSAIHDQAVPAAKAAWAAKQQGQFWAYYDALFTQQEDLGEPLYEQIAVVLGLDLEQFERDRNSPAATAAVNTDMALGEEIGVTGTPTFFLNGASFPGQDLSEMEQALAQVQP